MPTTPGRPRKACGTCKKQKIRCSGERPSCRRCTRLQRRCIYNSDSSSLTQGHRGSFQGSREGVPSRRAQNNAKCLTRVSQTENQGPQGPPRPRLPPAGDDDLSHGIPASLVLPLIEEYFKNVYQSDLLLHRALFLESLSAGTVRSHVLLSVCAWGAKFYRDESGVAILKNQGFMVEWAKRAGALVLYEAEDLCEENVVTFCNLALFWHSQGSWRISYFYKGNACQLLHIIGLGPNGPQSENPLRSEMRRRRLWACYLMHCFSSEKLFNFDAIAGIHNLELPWHEEDFEAGVRRAPSTSLNGDESHRSLYGELIQGLTLWAAVVSTVRSAESSLDSRIRDILVLDNKISTWWEGLQPSHRLEPSTIAAVAIDKLPKTLLTNLLYHQSLCALHSSIIPLFCWSPGGNNWASARKLSAQTAFENACAASGLIGAVFTACPRLSAMPVFVAHVAYCSSAIQIPFLWCTEPRVRERAQLNVRSNVKMMHAMASDWKFASLLQVYTRCLYDIHNRDPPRIGNEPKHADISEFTSFKVDAYLARSSILEFTGVLRSSAHGYAEPGEESNDLGANNGSSQERCPDAPASAPRPHQSLAMGDEQDEIGDEGYPRLESAASAENHMQTRIEPARSDLPFSPIDSQQERPSRVPLSPKEWPTADLFNSPLDPEMTAFFSISEDLDLSQFDTDLSCWDFLDAGQSSLGTTMD